MYDVFIDLLITSSDGGPFCRVCLDARILRPCIVILQAFQATYFRYMSTIDHALRVAILLTYHNTCSLQCA